MKIHRKTRCDVCKKLVTVDISVSSTVIIQIMDVVCPQCGSLVERLDRVITERETRP